MIFKPDFLDYDLSPYTGLTYKSWVQAGEYLLKGIFQNIKHFEDPVVMPRKENVVTYPHSKDAVGEYKAECFEGLARSFFIAAPLIHINPKLEIEGYMIRDYYKAHVLRICDKDDPVSVGSYEELIEISQTKDPFCCFQQTVETCALVICLWSCKEEIWDTYTKEEKDKITNFLMGFAHGNTVPQNWRLFNMLNLAFLHMEGYPVDTDIMRDHAQAILGYYAGDGWYRDGHSFDYYSCWAFNVYTAMWNLWYGYEHEPYLAARFEENSNQLMKTYGDFFDRDGFVNMWGRSNIYRNAATSAFAGNMLFRNSEAEPGNARRISSGALMQFLGREDFLHEGVPTLGFYGQFTPLVQGYSCAESPLWLGKAFMCLHLPSTHPFWTEKETEGSYAKLSENEVKTTILDGPALCFSNYKDNGTTILRTGKVLKEKQDDHGMWNYGKLSYHSKYPWEAEKEKGIESQQYVLHDLTDDSYEKGNAIFWSGYRDNVLYRKQIFGYSLNKEMTWMQAANLADFSVPLGLVRVDKLRLYRRPVSLTLGTYGFPDNGTEIIHYEMEGAKAIVLKGRDFTGKEKQLAVTFYDGFDEACTYESQGTNPDSYKSIVAYGKLTRHKQYGYEQYILISQTITKDNFVDFSQDELFPIQEIIYTDPERKGGYGPITIILKDGNRRVINFERMEGRLML